MRPASRNAGETSDRQYVTALARGLRILRCFNGDRPSMGTADLARMIGLPQATVWRLCHTLIEEGYLIRLDTNGKLRPGTAVLTLGYSALSSTALPEMAKPEMQAIAERHKGTVLLAARDGANMIYLQRCLGAEIIVRGRGVGSTVPLLTSAIGWAYLAGLQAKALKDLFAELRKTDPKLVRENQPKIRRSLEQFATTGLVINKGVLYPQINSVAVPIVSRDGAEVFSLSCGGLTQVFNDARLESAGLELRKLAQHLAVVLPAEHAS